MRRRTRKGSIAWWKNKLWGHFTKYVKLRDGYKCFTCDKFATGRGINGGHFITAAVCPPSLYFHEDNVHAQCARCNLVLEGNHYEYGIRLGKRRVNALRKVQRESHGEIWTVEDYQKKIEIYKEKYIELCKKRGIRL